MKNMTNAQFVKHLNAIGACHEAVIWVTKHGGTFAECWRDCKRGDWMNWLLVKDRTKFCITKRQLVGALAECAELSLKYFEAKYPDDTRVRDCIKTCKRYALGLATGKELETASSTVSFAFAAAAADAAYASSTVSFAASAAAAAAATRAFAAAAADAAYAAATAHAAAAKAKTLKRCADIFHKHFAVEE